jgi:hypothetical protein
MAKQNYTLVTWDWRESPDIEDVQKALKKGYNNLYDLDTGGDEYCWLFSKTKLNKKQIKEIEKQEFYEDYED